MVTTHDLLTALKSIRNLATDRDQGVASLTDRLDEIADLCTEKLVNAGWEEKPNDTGTTSTPPDAGGQESPPHDGRET